MRSFRGDLVSKTCKNPMRIIHASTGDLLYAYSLLFFVYPRFCYSFSRSFSSYPRTLWKLLRTPTELRAQVANYPHHFDSEDCKLSPLFLYLSENPRACYTFPVLRVFSAAVFRRNAAPTRTNHMYVDDVPTPIFISWTKIFSSESFVWKETVTM
jgi:hypothetical protein